MAEEIARTHSGQRKYEALDGLRGLAAVVVVFGHYLIETIGFRFAGYIVVDFFLVLSGFVLSHAYFSKPMDYGSYVRNRIARCWPTHALIILIVAAALLVLKDTYSISEFVMKMTMTHNLGMGPEWPIYNWSSWTVACEFWINMAIGLLFVTLPVMRRSLLLLCVICFTISAACYTTLFIYPGHLDAVLHDFGLFLNTGLIRCLGAFCLGMVTYRVFRLYDHLIRPHLTLGVGVVITLFFLALVMNPVENTRFDFLAIIALPLTLYYYVSADNVLTRIPAKLTFLGAISYSLYLVHWPVLDAVYLVFERFEIPLALENPVNLVMVNVISFSISFVGAVFLQRYVELPMYLKFKDSRKVKQRKLEARQAPAAGPMQPAE